MDANHAQRVITNSTEIVFNNAQPLISLLINNVNLARTVVSLVPIHPHVRNVKLVSLVPDHAFQLVLLTNSRTLVNATIVQQLVMFAQDQQQPTVNNVRTDSL